jgi:hypothetical protein
MLSTIASYKETVNAAKTAHKMTEFGEFDTPDIKWNHPDASFQDKIEHKYITSTVMDTNADDTWGLFVGVVAIFPVMFIYFMVSTGTLSQHMTAFFVSSAIITVCVAMLALCIYNIYVVKPRMQQKLLKGEYLVTDLEFVCASKETHVESSQRSTHAYFTTNVLYNIGLHSFEDGGIPYLYMIGDDVSDCETKLKYSQYKLLKFEYENWRHKKQTHYAICGLLE